MDEAQRKAYRDEIAAMIEESAEAIADFAADKHRAVLLTALVLRLGEVPPRVASQPQPAASDAAVAAGMEE